jgi:YesN/AraC family two-component response regulator
MIVEDEPLERMALRKMIQRLFLDLEILEDAKNGEEAILKTKLLRPHILLMDIRMPEMNGLEAQKRIIQAFPAVKTIIFSAYSDFQYAQEAIKHGVVEYLLKPVPPEDLKNALNKAIAAIQTAKTADTEQS